VSCTCLQNYTIGTSALCIRIRIPKLNISFVVCVCVCVCDTGRSCSVRVLRSWRKTWWRPTRSSVKLTSSSRKCASRSSSQSPSRFQCPTSVPTDGWQYARCWRWCTLRHIAHSQRICSCSGCSNLWNYDVIFTQTPSAVLTSSQHTHTHKVNRPSHLGSQ